MKIRQWLGLALLLCLSNGCGVEPLSEDFPSATLRTSPESIESFQTGLKSSNINGVDSHWLETSPLLLLAMDPAIFEPHLIASPDKGVSALSALKNDGLQIVIGSGYSTNANNFKPVGLLKADSVQLNPLEPYGYTRILGFNDDEFGVVHRNAYQQELFTDALQVGPGIIEQGKLDISEKDLQRPKYFRSVVALCDQRWVLGVSLEPMNLRTLGVDLISFFDKEKLVCSEVINLAGDRQAVIAVKLSDGSIAYHGEAHVRKISFLGFKPR
jgi:hypothetical protein